LQIADLALHLLDLFLCLLPDLFSGLWVCPEREQLADLLKRKPELLSPLHKTEVGQVLAAELAVASRTAWHRWK
jgi:hypothetical protein